MSAVPITLDQLERAVENDELSFHYQPFVSLLTGRIAGAEALLRWTPPSGELVLPDRFVPVAEEKGFITEITLHMLPRLLADWFVIDGTDPHAGLSVNISSQDLQSNRVVRLIETAIDREELDPERLGIEVTESSLLQANADVQRHLSALVEMGVTLIMDDYGTGFSSIDTLSQWPFSCIKLDRALISRMETSRKSTRIVAASVRMAHELGLSVVAEGVHSPDCYEFLMRTGCSRAQGNWISPALPLPDLLGFMQQHHSWSALPEGLLYLAQLDHIEWRRMLITAVTRMTFGQGSPSEPLCETPEMDHRRCGLGQWYYGSGQAFSENPAFTRLEPVHRQLHELGSDLLAAAENRASRSLLTHLMQRVSDTSLRVISLLQEMENGAALSGRRSGYQSRLCGPP
jgi:EAL domain-containing protein (putative c-di-GMP-specific phosphodiesterase class I)